ncbi:hypothetical protein EDD37DRAFT_329690 [Exophiala viscosa]|uniref:Uncharacterized protein n=1 Tax=Exophiala viscosa TaxID=2486360 RepID=A0AAN6DUE4_9EURO|nr:hypothetical protein EDD36DRAFT_252530 [Exophiala viscosa]KAI1626064.1 hypothetical protein EDD37DRAFT_329690 [Exophiala viscosa]
MSATSTTPETTDAEDREIVETLAKLQSMSTQITALRTLLPEKLINPTRFALENPLGYDPEKLADYLQDAALAGSQDLVQFKKDWHSEDVRQLWHAVNTGDAPQGEDAWSVDYGDLVIRARNQHSHSAMVNGLSSGQQHQTDADLARIVSDFRAKHPDIKFDVADEAHPLPLNITIAQLDLRVEQNQTAGATAFTVAGKPNTEPFALRDSIVDTIGKSGGTSNLGVFLEMLAAYSDVKTRHCDKCNKLVNNELLLPLVRQLKPESSNEHVEFLALHQDCV